MGQYQKGYTAVTSESTVCRNAECGATIVTMTVLPGHRCRHPPAQRHPGPGVICNAAASFLHDRDIPPLQSTPYPGSVSAMAHYLAMCLYAQKLTLTISLNVH